MFFNNICSILTLALYGRGGARVASACAMMDTSPSVESAIKPQRPQQLRSLPAKLWVVGFVILLFRASRQRYRSRIKNGRGAQKGHGICSLLHSVNLETPEEPSSGVPKSKDTWQQGLSQSKNPLQHGCSSISPINACLKETFFF